MKVEELFVGAWVERNQQGGNDMITEDYVSFETAKLLKEKGFDENTPVNYFVGDDKPRGCVVGEMIYHKRGEEDAHLIACPTLQMTMKWLRKNYNIHIEPRYFPMPNIYRYVIIHSSFTNKNIDSHPQYFNTYEQACESGIKYCLENLI